MSIYTRTGDDGTTSAFGGKRILKSALQVEAYGQIDELGSFIGLLIARIDSVPDKNFLTETQRDLYLVMSFLSGAKNNVDQLSNRVKEIEKKIDFIEKKLPKLNRFILPQGSEIACLFQITRAVCRRAERNVIRYFDTPTTDDRLLITKYLNRLSDLFFILARRYSKKEECFAYL